MTGFDLAYLALAPLAIPAYLWKLWRAGRPAGPLWDRLRGPFLPPGEKPRIWVHAVSVGEAVAARTLVEELSRACPEHETVVSASTETGRDVAARLYGPGRNFPCPLDLSGPVRRAFDEVKPALLVLMELEIWPNLIAEAARRGVPVAVVNGRLTERAARGYLRVRRFLGPTMRRVALYAVQDAVYAERFKAIGAPVERVEITGSMKYDAVSVSDAPNDEKIRRRLGLGADSLVLVGGSTHPGEEAALLAAAAGLRERFANLRVVLVPRHVNRAGKLAAEIEAAGWKPVLWSERKAAPSSEREGLKADHALVVDTVGDLGEVYRAADLVFVGGSLIPHGGQNMMEPAGLGLPVIYGPHTANFRDTVERLGAAGGGRTVADCDELRAALEDLLADGSKREEMGRAAREAMLAARGATERNVELLKGLLAPARDPGSRPARPGP